jgi:gliding motility-associated-like protein
MKEVKLEIYDVWGGLLYVETSVSNTFGGWNGTIDDKPLENGNYIFQVEAISRNGIKIKKTGPFTILK